MGEKKRVSLWGKELLICVADACVVSQGVSVSYPMAMAFVALTSPISFIYLLFSEDLLQAFTAPRLAAGDQHRQVTTAGAVPSLLRLTPSPPPAAPRAVIHTVSNNGLV